MSVEALLLRVRKHVSAADDAEAALLRELQVARDDLCVDVDVRELAREFRRRERLAPEMGSIMTPCADNIPRTCALLREQLLALWRVVQPGSACTVLTAFQFVLPERRARYVQFGIDARATHVERMFWTFSREPCAPATELREPPLLDWLTPEDDSIYAVLHAVLLPRAQAAVASLQLAPDAPERLPRFALRCGVGTASLDRLVFHAEALGGAGVPAAAAAAPVARTAIPQRPVHPSSPVRLPPAQPRAPPARGRGHRPGAGRRRAGRGVGRA